MKLKKYNIVVCVLCCITMLYLNASDLWWNWAASLVERARQSVVRDYLPSSNALAASVVGSGLPGSFALAGWARGWGQQATPEVCIVDSSHGDMPQRPCSPQLRPTQPPVAIPQRVGSASNLLQLAAITSVTKKTFLPEKQKQTIHRQVSYYITPQSKSEPELPKFSYTWAAAEFQGRRKSMGDAYAAAFEYPYFFAGVYDGHGGNKVSQILAHGAGLISPLHKTILQKVTQSGVDVKKTIKESFLEVDTSLYADNSKMNMGSAAFVLLFNVVNGQCYCAWVGDSTCLIINRKDNKFSALGGGVAWSAFGDFDFARKYQSEAPIISAEPEIRSFNIKKDGHYAIFLGSKSIFKSKNSNVDIAHILVSNPVTFVSSDFDIKTYGDNEKLKQTLRNIIVNKKGSGDNMTAILIDIQNK